MPPTRLARSPPRPTTRASSPKRSRRPVSTSLERGISTGTRCARRFAISLARRRRPGQTPSCLCILPVTACSSRAKITSSRWTRRSIESASDVASETVRISDYTQRLSGLPLKASFIVVDAARNNPFAKSGPPLAGGLALVEPDPNVLLAFNAAPGTVGPDESGPYGAYAQALAEMIREGGLSPSKVFDGVRMRVGQETKGAEVPWHASKISAPFIFFQRAADAPPPALEASRMTSLAERPMRELGVQDAYASAITRDTVQSYEEFLADYPSDPLAKRARALLAARREAITWRRTSRVNTPDAYWSYLGRYPNGPHAAEAHWRLEALSVPVAPPPSFTPIVYDVPPPPPAEIVYVERPVLILADPVFALPPPPPVVFLAPPPPYLVFTPPLVVAEPFVLPIPVFVPIPAYVDPPPYIAPPVNNVVFANIHNTVVTNNITRIINEQATPVAGARGVAAGAVAGAAAAAIAAKVAMPPAVAKRAEMIRAQGPRENGPGQAPGLTGKPFPGQETKPGAFGERPQPGGAGIPPGHALPGTAGKPLPSQEAKPGPGASPRRALPGTAGKPLPGQEAKPGAFGEKPQRGSGAHRVPPSHAVPGAAGKPLPAQEAKPRRPGGEMPQAAPRGAAESVPGAAGRGKRPSEHVQPGGGQLPAPSSPSGRLGPEGGKAGRTRPPGFLPGERGMPGGLPGEAQPHGPGAAEFHGRPSGPGFPKPQQQLQRERQPLPPPPQTRRMPPVPGQSFEPRAPQPAFQPARQQAQQWRPPQQPWHPPQKQRGCGQPGLPPCH